MEPAKDRAVGAQFADGFGIAADDAVIEFVLRIVRPIGVRQGKSRVYFVLGDIGGAAGDEPDDPVANRAGDGEIGLRRVARLRGEYQNSARAKVFFDEAVFVAPRRLVSGCGGLADRCVAVPRLNMLLVPGAARSPRQAKRREGARRRLGKRKHQDLNRYASRCS
jgi:hypothetical protein